MTNHREDDDELSHRFRWHPARLLVVLGLIGTIVGSLRPWIEGAEFTGRPFALNGLARTADGWFLILGTLGLTWLVMNRSAGESRLAVVRAAPLVISIYLVGAINWAYGDASNLVQEAQVEGGVASIVPGFWVAVGSVALCIAGAAWLTLADLQRRGGWTTRAELARAFGPANLLPAVALALGSVLGTVTAVSLAVTAFPDAAFAWIYMITAILGFVFGAGLGYRIGRLLGTWIRGAIGGRARARSVLPEEDPYSRYRPR